MGPTLWVLMVVMIVGYGVSSGDDPIIVGEDGGSGFMVGIGLLQHPYIIVALVSFFVLLCFKMSKVNYMQAVKVQIKWTLQMNNIQ